LARTAATAKWLPAEIRPLAAQDGVVVRVAHSVGPSPLFLEVQAARSRRTAASYSSASTSSSFGEQREDPSPWLELSSRFRSDRIAHEDVTRRLAAAARAGELDGVEWRRMKGEFVAAVPQLRPSEVASALRGLATMHCAELDTVAALAAPLRSHVASYMTPQELLSSLVALSWVSPASEPSAACAAVKDLQESAQLLLYLLTRKMLPALTASELTQVLRAAQQLGLADLPLLEQIANHLPEVDALCIADILALLEVLNDMMHGKVSQNCTAIERHRLIPSVEGLLASVQLALRPHLSELLQQEVLQALLLSASLHRMLQEAAEESRVTGDSARSFHQLLLMELSSRGSDWTSLPASTLAGLLKVLGETCRSSSGLGGVAKASDARAMPAYVVTLITTLLEPLLNLLETMRTEELIDIIESLCIRLEYRDDYLEDRLAVALVPRLVPLCQDGAADSRRISQFCRACAALARSGPVATVTLLAPAVYATTHALDASVLEQVRRCLALDVLLPDGDVCSDPSGVCSWVLAVTAHLRGPEAQHQARSDQEKCLMHAWSVDELTDLYRAWCEVRAAVHAPPAALT